MPAPKNSLKAAILGDEVRFGLWISSTSAIVAELASTAGFDWCLIDGEHGPNDIPLILAQVQAMGAGSASIAVRLPENDTRLIKQVLDIGIQTLLVPMVNTADEARAAVAATRYAPRGVRGVGAAMARATKYGVNTDYLTTADDEICVIVQAETREALENLDDILAVDGVDCVFIGPADLAASLGHLGNPGHAEVQEAISDAAKRIKASGKALGLLSFDETQTEKLVALGGNFIAVAGDIVLLGNALRDRAAKAHALRPQ